MTNEVDRLVSVDAQQENELQPQEDETTYNDWEYDLIEYDQQEEY
jgi:hypothetical protein